MTDEDPSQKSSARNQLARALARWDNEGGAPGPEAHERDNKDGVLTQEEQCILQCLGGAVITQWNDLPTEIQRALFEHAVSMGEPSHLLALKEQIARFLHKHKERR